MFWIILFVISFMLLLLGTPNILSIVIITGMVVIGQGATGLFVYPHLTKQLTSIEKLNHLVNHKTVSAVEADILACYKTALITKKAKYIVKLRMAKKSRRTFTLYFFTHGWAISNKINDLPSRIDLL